MVNPVNPNATGEAKALLNFLYDAAGKKIISGQHTQTVPMQEINYIYQTTGKKPKLRGFELLAYSPNIVYEGASEECLKEVYENRDTMDEAIRWAKETNGIVTLTFHWFSPIGGFDKSFYTENTDFDASRILMEGTPERQAFYSDMEVIAKQLKRFQDEKIPVLWRPFHEAEGTWFWWGAKGPEVAGELFRLMYHYYTDICKLNNLLWVWNCMSDKGYPGDAYVDVVSMDTYLPEYKATDYKEEYDRLLNYTSKNKVAALAEIGYLPDIHLLEKSQVPWAYFMCWSGDFCIGNKFNKEENLRELYNSEYVITEL